MLTYLEKHFSRVWLLVFSVDFLILLITAIIASKIITNHHFSDSNIQYIYLGYLFSIAFILLSELMLFINELYNIEKKYKIKLLAFKCILSFTIVSIGSYFLFVRSLPYVDCFIFSMSACISILCWRFLFYWIISKINIQHKILFLGTDELSKRVVREILANDQPKFKVVGFLGTDPALVGKTIVNPKVLGLVEDLDSITQKEKVEKLIVSYSQDNQICSAKDLIKCKFRGIEVLDLHTFYEYSESKILLDDLQPNWLLFAQGFKKTRLIKFAKRIVDIAISSLGLLLSSPIIIITALLIKCESKGPIIYKQERVGENGHIFNLFKFRSMRDDAEKHSGPVWAGENDDRITRIGKIIRKLRIDEIPQMINVLKGNMSFVGPRPERPHFVEMLKEQIPYYEQRLSVKPGITGWAAVNYNYGATVEDAIEKLQYDLYYIKNISIFLDILTILKTIPIIFNQRGAR